MQTAFGDRRQRRPATSAGQSRAVTPVVVPQGDPGHRVSKGRASDGELTPTQGRPLLPLRHTDSEAPPRPLYARQTFAQSQPALAPRVLSQAASKQPASGYPPPLPPPQSPLPPIPQSVEDAEPLPTPYRPYGPQAMLKQRSAGELRTPAKAYGHRRGGRHELPDSNAQAPGSLGGQGHYIPDYSSLLSGSSMSSGFLSRGPSTISTCRSELRTDGSRLPPQAWGVQQDFFLAGLNLKPSQQRLLLVGLPYEAVQTYRRLYANDLAAAGLQEHQALAQEQLRARGDLTLLPEDQQQLLRACTAVQAAPWGNERLARCVRWALQADLEEQSFMFEQEIRRVPALSGQQLRQILAPLHLDLGQQARLNKHCSTLPP